MTHPLDGARKRIERANRFLHEIIHEVEVYARSEANNIVIDHDDVGNHYNVVLPAPSPLPAVLSLAVSDCIHNLRAALDYVVFELSREDSGDPDPKRTQFPICTESGFKELRLARSRKKGFLRYLSDAHVEAIEAYQPYKGVNWTQTLIDISNPDKQRELTVMRGRHRLEIASGRGETFKGVGPNRTDVKMGERQMTVRASFRDGLPVVETLEIMKREIGLLIDSFSLEFRVNQETA